MNIKDKRVSLNMTQDELAEKLNVSRATIAMWETGKAMPRADKLPELAKILGCTVSDLFDGDAVCINEERAKCGLEPLPSPCDKIFVKE